MRPLEVGNWLGEVTVTATERVNRLRVGQAETFGDLSRSNKVIHVDLPAHALHATR